jgi:4'-phosphopantetheinyl transferase
MPDPAPNGLRWRAVSAIDHPADDALHLWRIDLCQGDAATDAQALASLSARQQARHARLRLPIHRRRYLRAQAGCRAVLARYLGIEAAAIAFRYGSAGKPELAFGDGSLSFNLTGTGDLAVLAVGSHLPVGVDCEWVRPRPGLHAIARRMFPPQTAARLAGLPAAEQPLAFCLHWTSLEARVKADGRGLARHREADLPGLSVAHALVAGGTTDGCVCAVARQRLPGPERWQGFLLAPD